MTIWWYKIQTTVNSIVLDVLAVQSTFVREVLPKLYKQKNIIIDKTTEKYTGIKKKNLLVNVGSTNSPAILTVDSITESWGVHNGQS